MMHPIPAPGYTPTTGDRPPRKSWGDMVMVQLRNGWCDLANRYTASQLVWIHDGGSGDVVAVRRV